MQARVLLLIAAAGLVSSCVRHPWQEKDTDLGPAFRSACWHGDLDQVKALYAKGPPLEEGDRLNRRPLLLAARGNPEVVEFLLSKGANVNATAANGDTAFSIACEHGIMANVSMLFSAGARIDTVNKYGHTPLMLAAQDGHDDAVTFLLAHHVDPNFRTTDCTAIFFAIQGDHLSIVKQLLDAGAALSPPSTGHNPGPALLFAVETGDIPLVDLLLAHGENVNAADERHIASLLDATFQGTPEMIAHLLDKGADPNLAEDDGTTPLMSAVRNQDVPVIQLLLQHGARIDALDHNGHTALIRAAMLINNVAALELIRQKADVNIADPNYQTALTYAGDRGDNELVQALKKAGAKLTDLYIIPRAESNPPLSRAHLWAISIGAIYSQYNGETHFDLPDGKRDSDVRELKEEWNIENRELLLKNLQKFTDGDARFLAGHDKANGSPPPGTPGRLAKVYLAWDWCREVNQIREGVTVGFLTPDEAWPRLMAIAVHAQATFKSWQELNACFLEGRFLAYGLHDPRFESCAKLLLDPKDPNSPWNRLDWDTDLTEP